MWMCERCTWINRDSSSQCEKCRTERPGSEASAPKPRAPQSHAAPPKPDSDGLVQPKFRRNDPLLRVQKQVLRQADLHEVEMAQEDDREHLIAWDSAGHLGDAVRGIARKKRAEGAASINPPGSIADIPNIPAPQSKQSNTMAITMSIAVAVLLLIIAGIAMLISNTLSNNAASIYPYDSQSSGGVFAHQSLRAGLQGLWLGMDHGSSTAGLQGVPVKYIFLRSNLLIVVGANGAGQDQTMSESSYGFDGKTFTSALTGGFTSASGVQSASAPASAGAVLQRNVLTLTSGATSLTLQRPEDIIGQWTSELPGAATPAVFSLDSAGRISWSGVSEDGIPAAGSGTYSLSGSTILVAADSKSPQSAMWTFTFDAGVLVLYPRAAATDATPLRLKRQ